MQLVLEIFNETGDTVSKQEYPNLNSALAELQRLDAEGIKYRISNNGAQISIISIDEWYVSVNELARTVAKDTFERISKLQAPHLNKTVRDAIHEFTHALGVHLCDADYRAKMRKIKS